MGCMMNTLGVGSGRIVDFSNPVGYDESEYKNQNIQADPYRIANAMGIFFLWGTYKTPAPFSSNWKKFVNEARTSYLNLPPKYKF